MPAPAKAESAASFTESADAVTVTAKDLTVVIDKILGVPTSVIHKGQEWLVSPLRLNFWRPPTNNDEGAKLHHKLGIWRHAGTRASATSVKTAKDGNDVVVVSEMAIPAGDSSATIRFRVTGAGEIEIDTEFRAAAGQPDIPRIGYQCRIPTRTVVCKWYGRGPQENYADRNSGAWTAIHEGLVPTMFHRYADPQESGNRTGIRWASLTSPMGGASLRFDATGEHLLEMSIYPCSSDDITLAMHPSELPRRDYHTLNIDHRQSGLGGTDSWGALALPKYRLMPGNTYRWSYRFSFSETAAPPARSLPRQLPVPGKPPGQN